MKSRARWIESTLPHRLLISVGVCALVTSLFTASAFAQPPTNNPNEICGDGTTFTVNLPAIQGTLPDGVTVPDDSVTLPNGCRIYALIVSGYARGAQLDELTFYHLTQFVATNDGYVHFAWWNNLMGEYLSRPLHDPFADFSQTQLTPGNLMSVDALGFVPRDLPGATTFPKAVPDEDYQFQADAKLFVQAIRAHNPHAIIIVAGHSMGGNSVTRLGSDPTVPIDLLAPIDPVGNRSTPVGVIPIPNPNGPPLNPLGFTFNWNRWRNANNLLGFEQRDCVRDSLGLCQVFITCLQHFGSFCVLPGVSFQCTFGPLLDTRPLLGSLAPVACPQLLPSVITGPGPTIGGNVRYLYHRWQKEFIFPFDWGEDTPLTRAGPLTGPLGGNYQEPIVRNGDGENDPNKTCGLFVDVDPVQVAIQALDISFTIPTIGSQPTSPRDPNVTCSPFDGHGEIIGVTGAALKPYAVQAQDNWPCYYKIVPLNQLTLNNCDADPSKDEQSRAALRRQHLIEMANATPPDPNKTIDGPPNPTWPYEPMNPNLDFVSDDMITIVKQLLAQQPQTDITPPVSIASANPAANSNGWNSHDVVVEVTATDDPGGSGVKEIDTSLTGAQTGSTVTRGASAQVTINTEGTTTLTYFARDNAGNTEAPNTLTVKLDKTPPTIEATASPAPNASGWNNTDVTVSFTGADALSGLATLTPSGPVLVSKEGANQQIVGTATDLADNEASAAVMVSLDKTPPTVTCKASPNVLWPPNNKLVPINVSVLVNDSLSGAAGFTLISVTSNEPDSGQGDIQGFTTGIASTSGQLRSQRLGSGTGRVYTLTYSGSDRAGNTASCTTTVTVPHDHGT